MKKLSDKAIALVMYVFNKLEVQWRKVEEIWFSLVEKIMYLMQARYIWEYWTELIKDKFIVSPFWPELKNWNYVIYELWRTLKDIKEAIQVAEWKKWLRKYEITKLFNEQEIEHIKRLMFYFWWFQWSEIRLFTTNMTEVNKLNNKLEKWTAKNNVISIKSMEKYNKNILSSNWLIKK